MTQAACDVKEAVSDHADNVAAAIESKVAEELGECRRAQREPSPSPKTIAQFLPKKPCGEEGRLAPVLLLHTMCDSCVQQRPQTCFRNDRQESFFVSQRALHLPVVGCPASEKRAECTRWQQARGARKIAQFHNHDTIIQSQRRIPCTTRVQPSRILFIVRRASPLAERPYKKRTEKRKDNRT